MGRGLPFRNQVRGARKPATPLRASAAPLQFRHRPPRLHVPVGVGTETPLRCESQGSALPEAASTAIEYAYAPSLVAAQVHTPRGATRNGRQEGRRSSRTLRQSVAMSQFATLLIT